MKSIMISIPELLERVQEMSEDGMAAVSIAIIDETTDKCIFYPAFLHFEARKEDGSIKDFESIDALDPLKSA